MVDASIVGKEVYGACIRYGECSFFFLDIVHVTEYNFVVYICKINSVIKTAPDIYFRAFLIVSRLECFCCSEIRLRVFLSLFLRYVGRRRGFVTVSDEHRERDANEDEYDSDL